MSPNDSLHSLGTSCTQHQFFFGVGERERGFLILLCPRKNNTLFFIRGIRIRVRACKQPNGLFYSPGSPAVITDNIRAGPLLSRRSRFAAARASIFAMSTEIMEGKKYGRNFSSRNTAIMIHYAAPYIMIIVRGVWSFRRAVAFVYMQMRRAARNFAACYFETHLSLPADPSSTTLRVRNFRRKYRLLIFRRVCATIKFCFPAECALPDPRRRFILR